jgi:hypothetical protein
MSDEPWRFRRASDPPIDWAVELFASPPAELSPAEATAVADELAGRLEAGCTARRTARFLPAGCGRRRIRSRITKRKNCSARQTRANPLTATPRRSTGRIGDLGAASQRRDGYRLRSLRSTGNLGRLRAVPACLVPLTGVTGRTPSASAIAQPSPVSPVASSDLRLSAISTPNGSRSRSC